MSVITLFSGSHCNGEVVARKVVEMSGYTLMNEEALIAEASTQFGMDEGKLTKALMGKTSVFNKFTHERERSLACMKMTLSRACSKSFRKKSRFRYCRPHTFLSMVVR